MIGELCFRSIKNTDGTIKYLEGFITDVTEQKGIRRSTDENRNDSMGSSS
jgi:hypothetical protein